MKRVGMLLLVLSVTGCIRYYFQPPKPEYQKWRKLGVGELEIKKALLECGMTAPDPTSGTYEHAFGHHTEDEMVNHYLASRACMEHAGYKSTTDSFAESCSWDHHKHLSICQPGAEIPKPSIERRLNSWWCKLKTDREYCHKHAYVPSACDNPKKDYNNPPPECRP